MSEENQIVKAVSYPPITSEILRRYADAAGDPNPIHLDEGVARRAGLPGVIAHGMLIAAWVADRAQQFAGQSWRMSRFQTRFRAMTLLGDVVSIGGSVKESSVSRMVLELQARNPRGEVTTTASVTFEPSFEQTPKGPNENQ